VYEDRGERQGESTRHARMVPDGLRRLAGAGADPARALLSRMRTTSPPWLTTLPPGRSSVFVRFARPELWVWSGRNGMTSMIIEVETDEGLVGLGECAAWPGPGLTGEALRSIRRYALGEDPLGVERLWRRVLVLGGWRHAAPVGNPALSGFEISLWDLLGKAAGTPLHTLFGGALRDRAEYFYYLMRGPVGEVAREAKWAADAGFRTLYLKVGMGLEQDTELIAAVRTAACPHQLCYRSPGRRWRRRGSRRA
jgi:L-alanine-DL-glutamate epimerase-like enolase superfamily enzyme